MRIVREVPENGYKILVLDDEQGIIDSMEIFLKRSGYKVEGMVDPVKAIERLKNEEFDLLLLDYMMKPMKGTEVIEEVRKFNKNIYILLLTGYKDLVPPLETIRKYDIQGYCEKSNNPNQILLLIESALKSVAQVKQIKEINESLKKANIKMEEAYLGTIEALRIAVDAKDSYTKGHSDRVAYYSRLLAKELELDEVEQQRIYIGGLFHDIGKIGVPDNILQKPGKLTDDEYSQIKKHPKIGENIIDAATMFEDIITIVEYHHERFDGKGYPEGLIGKDIPFYARIVAIADAFDAMTSDRNYRPRLTFEETLEEIERNYNKQFDQDLAEKFVQLIRRDREKIEKELNYKYV